MTMPLGLVAAGPKATYETDVMRWAKLHNTTAPTANLTTTNNTFLSLAVAAANNESVPIDKLNAINMHMSSVNMGLDAIPIVQDPSDGGPPMAQPHRYPWCDDNVAGLSQVEEQFHRENQ